MAFDNTKPPTHAGYLNSLVYCVLKNPNDKETLSALLYTVYDDAALEIFPGKFFEGLTVNDSFTPEDLSKVIESARRLAEDRMNNVAWPDADDHSEKAGALRKVCHEYADALIEDEEPAAHEPDAKDHPELCLAIDKGAGCASRIIHGRGCPGAESCPVKQYEDETGEQENAEMEPAPVPGTAERAAQETADPAALVFHSLAEYKL